MKLMQKLYTYIHIVIYVHILCCKTALSCDEKNCSYLIFTQLWHRRPCLYTHNAVRSQKPSETRKVACGRYLAYYVHVSQLIFTGYKLYVIENCFYLLQTTNHTLLPKWVHRTQNIPKAKPFYLLFL
jgi:hypothetical protein